MRASRVKVIEVTSCFAHPHERRLAGPALVAPADDREGAPGPVTREERQRRARRVENQAAAARELDPLDLAQRTHALLEAGLQVAGVARVGAAQVELRRKHRVEPVVQRMAERRHHDRHRRHQREARHDRRKAHRRLPRRAAELRHGEREEVLDVNGICSKTQRETRGIKAIAPMRRHPIEA